MNFTYLNKFLLIFASLFILCCQDNISLLKDTEKETQNNNIKESSPEVENLLDTKINQKTKNNYIDFYSYQNANYDFYNKKLINLRVNSYQGKVKSNLPINVIYNDSFIYSVNLNGSLVKFNNENGKQVEKYKINQKIKNKIPVSFSLIDNDFIIGFKSGEVIRVNKTGDIKWTFKKNNLLNTPIKHLNDNILILYSENIVILSSKTGKVIFEKKYKSSNIIQSSGGKIVDYFNLIFFILPNSEFNVIDVFLFDEHYSELSNLNLKTSLNNLNDKIYVYKNILLYLDNKSILNSYDLKKNEFILSNYIINDLNSPIFFNNSLIDRNEKNINFYNINTGKIFLEINIDKILKNDSKIIKVLNINNYLHLFTNEGEVLILNNKYEIDKKIELKIKNISKIYSYQDKIFILSNKGFTYIY